MGLDITAVSKLVRIEIPEGIETWSDEYYEWEQNNGLDLWNFESESYNSEGESYSFRAGSYSGAHQWMKWLHQAKNQLTNDPNGTAFDHVVHNNTVDDFMWTQASQESYRDFVKYHDDIMDIVDGWYLGLDPNHEIDKEDFKWFQEKYDDWQEAFRVAYDNGAVIYH